MWVTPVIKALAEKGTGRTYSPANQQKAKSLKAVSLAQEHANSKGAKMAEVEFKTVKEETEKFGKNNFVEIARKIAVTEEGENEFISLSKGFFSPEGEKRFSRGKNVSLPADKELITKVIDDLKKVLK